jgi:Spy/CpxP family protein refolding chaperone
MRIKSIIAGLLIVMLGITTVSAQQHQKHDKKGTPERFYKPGSEKFRAMKIAYLTEKLDLTPAEAEKFWPVYNEFQTKKEVIFKELKTLKRANKQEDKEVSDAEIEKMLNQRIITKQKELDLEKEYLAKFKSVLPISKVGKFYKAEEGFKRDLLRKMRDTPPPPTPPTNKKQ